MLTLEAELKERRRLLDKESLVVADLDDQYTEATEVYQRARESAYVRVERMHAEVLEIERAMGVLVDASV
jgi:hypothetical protein